MQLQRRACADDACDWDGKAQFNLLPRGQTSMLYPGFATTASYRAATGTLFLAIPRTQPHNHRYNHLAIATLQLLTDAESYAYVQVWS